MVVKWPGDEPKGAVRGPGGQWLGAAGYATSGQRGFLVVFVVRTGCMRSAAAGGQLAGLGQRALW